MDRSKVGKLAGAAAALAAVVGVVRGIGNKRGQRSGWEKDMARRAEMAEAQRAGELRAEESATRALRRRRVGRAKATVAKGVEQATMGVEAGVTATKKLSRRARREGKHQANELREVSRRAAKKAAREAERFSSRAEKLSTKAGRRARRQARRIKAKAEEAAARARQLLERAS